VISATTGEFCTSEFHGPDAAATLAAELRRLSPAECVTPAGQEEPFDLPGFRTARDVWHFHPEATRDHLARHFRVAALDAFGCADAPLATASAGALLAYVAQTNPRLVPLFTGLRRYHADGFLQLDGPTRRNLNLTFPPTKLQLKHRCFPNIIIRLHHKRSRIISPTKRNNQGWHRGSFIAIDSVQEIGT